MTNKVILIHPSGSEFEFEGDHAERILNMPGGWKKKRTTAKGQKTKAGADKRAKTDTRIEAQQEDDCGCN